MLYSSEFVCSEAWFIDCDTLWFQAVTSSKPTQLFGHCFASMDAASGSGCRGSQATRKLYWSKNYLRHPNEEIFLASPFRLPAKSPWAQEALELLNTNLVVEPVEPKRRSKSLAYNFFMDLAASRLNSDSTCLMSPLISQH